MNTFAQKSLTLERLSEDIGCSPYRLKIVLDQEVELGRVAVDGDGDGDYSIVPEAFDPNVLRDMVRWWPR